MVMDSDGNLYVCDTNNHVIRKIDLSANVTTFAGTGIAGDLLGQKDVAQFNRPSGIAIDSDGNFFIVDKDNQKIKVIRTTGMVEWIAGSGQKGYADGFAEDAMFNQPVHICIDEFDNLFISGNNDNRIRKIESTTHIVSTFAGNNNQDLIDGTGVESSFFLPQGLAIDRYNNIFVGDRGNHAIRKISPDGNVTTIAGGKGSGFLDGPINEALFNGPKGLTVDSIGNIYVADRLNFVIRKIDTFGIVSTIAGTPLISGYIDGTLADRNLIGRAVDVISSTNQSLLVSDWENEVIRKIDLDLISATENQFNINPEKIKIYPNPCKDILTIEGNLPNEFVVLIFDNNGKLLHQSLKGTRIDMTTFRSGVYIIQILGNDTRYQNKIIKQ